MGLSQYRFAPVVQRGRVYAVASTGYGRGEVKLAAARPALRAVRAGRPLTEQVIAPTSVELPVERGDRLGEVRVYQRGRLVARQPLVADRSVSEPNLAGRVSWYVSETENLVGFFS